jgi:hypothetical protein
MKYMPVGEVHQIIRVMLLKVIYLKVLTFAFYLCVSHLNCPNCVWMLLRLLHVCRHGDSHLLWSGYTLMLMTSCDIMEHENMHTGWAKADTVYVQNCHTSVVIGNLQSLTSVILNCFRFMVW